MFKKLTLAAAAGAGYVLGAKAGQQRYQQIEAKFREIAGMPAVQNATSAVKENAAPLLDSAKSTVTEKVSSSKSSDSTSSPAPVVTSPPPATTTTSTTSTPPVTTRPTAAAGAAPSTTAPSGTGPVTRP